MACPICGGVVGGMADVYPNLICDECDSRAVDAAGNDDRSGVRLTSTDEGVITFESDHRENPVFVDGRQCWRRYRFGGWVTMLDRHDCDSLSEFYDRHDFFKR